MRRFILTAWVLVAACFIAALATLSRPVLAQSPRLDKAAWIGVKVMPKLYTVVKVGDDVVDDPPLPWTVQDVKGEWLSVGEATKGWVKRSDVCTLDEAPAYYTKVIDEGIFMFDDEDVDVLNLRAIAWKERGELDRAIADYSEAIRRIPTAMGHTDRGIIWVEKNDYEKAIADFNQAIRLDPKYMLTYAARANAWGQKGELDKAIADFTQAIELDPTNSSAYAARGLTWAQKNEFDKAIADYNQAIRLNPKDRDTYGYRGRAWCLKREYEKAIADFQLALQIDPNNASAYNDSAWLRATCPEARYRDGERAVANATRACELTGWTDFTFIETLAAAYAEGGDFNSAIKYQQKAIELDPHDAGHIKWANERIAQYREKKPYRE